MTNSIKRKATRPLLIKIISILLFIYALWINISGMYGTISLVHSLSFGESLSQILNQENPKKVEEIQLRLENRGIEYNENTLYVLFIIGFILLLAYSIFVIFLGIFFWKGKNWARITIIVLVFIFSFGSLISLITGNLVSILNFGFSLLIGIYLLINKEAKAFFKNASR